MDRQYLEMKMKAGTIYGGAMLQNLVWKVDFW